MGWGGGGAVAIISEEYAEPGFWSSCFQMFPETCTSAAKIFSSWNFEAVRNSLPASSKTCQLNNTEKYSYLKHETAVSLKTVGGATGFPADISVL